MVVFSSFYGTMHSRSCFWRPLIPRVLRILRICFLNLMHASQIDLYSVLSFMGGYALATAGTPSYDVL